MRALRLLLAGLLLLAAAGFVLAWFGPGWFDWGQYRGSIAAFASERLGRQVRIAGPVSFRLLPEPVLTASDVSLADAGDGVAVSAAQLRLRVGLRALISGRIEAQELVLRKAEMRVPWPFRPLRIAADAPHWFAVASVRVEDGALSIGALRFTGIAGALTTDIWTGSYAASGLLQFSGRPWHFSVRLSRAGSDGSAGLDVALDGRGPVQGVGAKLSGQIQGDGSFAGRVTGRGPDLSQLLPAPQAPFTAAGRVTMAGGLAAADELTGDIGGSPVKGAIALRLSPAVRLDIALAASSLALDSWLPAVLRGTGAGFPMGIDISAEAAQLAGGTLRRLRTALDIAPGSIAVRELHALLPGEASLGATGQVTARPGATPRFQGKLAFSAPAFRTTLSWLEAAGVVPAAVLPEGVLRNLEFTGQAVLEPGLLALSGLEGRLDEDPVSGSVIYRTGDRPAMTVALQADRLVLDPWLPGDWPALADVPARLDRFDLDLRLGVREALLRDVAFGPADLDASVEAGRVRLRGLQVAGAGLTVALSGTLGGGGRISDGRLELRAGSAQAVAASLPAALARWRDLPDFWRGPARFTVQASGAPESLALKLAGSLGDVRLEAEPVLDLPGRRASGVLTLRHPGAPRLAEALGLRGAPAWLGDGSLGLVAQLAVLAPKDGPARVTAENFNLTAGGLRAGGSLVLDGLGGAGTVPRLTGKITAEALPLPLPPPRSPEPLGFGLLAGWQAQLQLEAAHVLAGGAPAFDQAAATLTLGDSRLSLDGTAKLDGGTLRGALAIDAAAAQPVMTLHAELSGATLPEPLFGLPVDIASGRLESAIDLSAAGHSPAALLATLAGEARFGLADGRINGVSLGAMSSHLNEAAVRQALAGGSTGFTRLDLALRARSGVLRVNEARMSGPSGTAELTGSVDLAGDQAQLRLGLRPAVPDPPEIGLGLTGPLEALQREPELAGLAHWRAEHQLRD